MANSHGWRALPPDCSIPCERHLCSGGSDFHRLIMSRASLWDLLSFVRLEAVAEQFQRESFKFDKFAPGLAISWFAQMDYAIVAVLLSFILLLLALGKGKDLHRALKLSIIGSSSLALCI